MGHPSGTPRCFRSSARSGSGGTDNYLSSTIWQNQGPSYPGPISYTAGWDDTYSGMKVMYTEFSESYAWKAVFADRMRYERGLNDHLNRRRRDERRVVGLWEQAVRNLSRFVSHTGRRRRGVRTRAMIFAEEEGDGEVADFEVPGLIGEPVGFDESTIAEALMMNEATGNSKVVELPESAVA
ncbi:hypothetical protein BOTBODRAFT_37310 [Botryobasidium botryosum FD-172 SS1]|uniref:Uncharacterized protein n=1 Tax=Botryobasidium botryosum (strain FD-172 SS1) TaxID=930990 RepID=A0A067MBU1_BOTB1|nr:hypothetical protein BOTBODRAFT_37310 [Botryobasidium botryosum FD-172 SS1]